MPYLTAAAIPHDTATAFCSAFPARYSVRTLVDETLRPSPYLDLLAVMRAINNEGVGCGRPRGCLGEY
jgi:hypothetical protein